MACCRVKVLYCIAVKPDDSLPIRKEDALVRKLAGSRGKTMACCRVEVLYCIAVEPDDSLPIRKEDALVRKLAGSRCVSQGRNNDDMMDDHDEMIFGKKAGGTSEGGHDTKKPQSTKDDLITF
ncbi:hypothetical protein F0562_018208 [Nyssa sinensis]|uniref:Uncharacterized protein n=1 Tax=Nyssa sinensis TaxID=561372 RepID=A0A5J4Z8V0_9ASTE|nr:hypothetical protein F0562_018208 [Nyssa sinensis]